MKTTLVSILEMPYLIEVLSSRSALFLFEMAGSEESVEDLPETNRGFLLDEIKT